MESGCYFKDKTTRVMKDNKLNLNPGPTYAEITCKRIANLCDQQNVKRAGKILSIKEIIKISHVISKK